MINAPSRYSGRFITIDGSEGTGKSTQMSLIAKWLTKRKIPFILTREPGGTNLGEQLRTILLNNDTQADELSELFIMLAARRQHLVEKIWPALRNGKWVISDRFNDATYAYQGFGRGINTNVIADLERTIMGEFAPDKRFIFTSDTEIANTRLLRRASKQDRFEQEEEAFFTRVKSGFDHRIKSTNAILIDANCSIEQVFKQISSHLEALI